MGEPIEIIIRQGNGGNATASSFPMSGVLKGNNLNAQKSSASSSSSSGRGWSMSGSGPYYSPEMDSMVKQHKKVSAAQAVIILEVGQQAFNLVMQNLKHQQSLQAQLSGDYVAANNAQMAIDFSSRAINKAFSLGISVAGGAALGSFVPGIGNAAGAAAGLAAWTINEVVSIAKKVEQGIYNIQSTLNNYQIMQTQMYSDLERAGMPSYSGSRNTRY